MTAVNPLSIPEAWDNVAEGYAAETLPMLSLYAADALELADLSPRAHVVDVAAGPGTLSLLAAREAERVAAVDFSPEMIRVLTRRAKADGLQHVEIYRADGQHLPFAEAEFDAGFSMFGLIFFPDRAAGFRELRRVLKSGGRAVVSSWAPMDDVPLLASYFEALGDLSPGPPSGFSELPLEDADAFRAELEAAGFEQVEIHVRRHAVEIPSVRAFLSAQERSSATTALMKKKLAAHSWDRLQRDLAARLEAKFGTGPLELEFVALLGTGMRPRQPAAMPANERRVAND